MILVRFSGTMAHVAGEFIPEVGSLFSFDKRWKATKQDTGITVSNGLAWSEDLKHMYYIDSTKLTVDVFDFDAKTAKLCKYFRFSRKEYFLSTNFKNSPYNKFISN